MLLKDLDGLLEALHWHWPQGVDLHQPFDQSEGRGSQPDAAWGSELFHPRRQVGGLTDGGIVHMEVVADGPHDDFTGVEAHTRLHLQAVGAADVFSVAAKRGLHGQGGVAGPYGVIFVGHFVAEGGPLSLNGTPVAELNALMAELREAAARRQTAEGLLRDSEQRLRFALNAAQLGWWQYDPLIRTLSGDSRFKEIFDLEDQEVAIDRIMKRVFFDDTGRVRAAFEAALHPATAKPLAIAFRILDALGVEAPESIKGHTQSPIDGVSMRSSFDDAARYPTDDVRQALDLDPGVPVVQHAMAHAAGRRETVAP